MKEDKKKKKVVWQTERELTRSEARWFTDHPKVAGMTTKSGIVVNPNVPKGQQREAVVRNEQIRGLLRSGQVPRPTFPVTPAQVGLGYPGTIQDLRETIVGRMASGDPSAGGRQRQMPAPVPTSAQRAYWRRLRKLLEGGE